MVGKMPTKVCMNANIGNGILPTLPSTVIFPDYALFAEPQSGKITVRQYTNGALRLPPNAPYLLFTNFTPQLHEFLSLSYF